MRSRSAQFERPYSPHHAVAGRASRLGQHTESVAQIIRVLSYIDLSFRRIRAVA